MNYDERFVFFDLTVNDKKTRLVWTRDANIAGRRLAEKVERGGEQYMLEKLREVRKNEIT